MRVAVSLLGFRFHILKIWLILSLFDSAYTDHVRE
jgi:hypothetical protein